MATPTITNLETLISTWETTLSFSTFLLASSYAYLKTEMSILTSTFSWSNLKFLKFHPPLRLLWSHHNHTTRPPQHNFAIDSHCTTATLCIISNHHCTRSTFSINNSTYHHITYLNHTTITFGSYIHWDIVFTTMALISYVRITEHWER